MTERYGQTKERTERRGQTGVDRQKRTKNRQGKGKTGTNRQEGVGRKDRPERTNRRDLREGGGEGGRRPHCSEYTTGREESQHRTLNLGPG